jgi:hypothetical protein
VKKVLIGLVVVVLLILAVVAAIPVVSATVWKTDTANDLTDMFGLTTKNLEKSTEFLSNTEPSKAQYESEIQRINESVSKTAATIDEINDLGPSTVDLTGQYSAAERLQGEISANLKGIQANYKSQLDLLTKEQEEGVTVASATEYGNLSEELSQSYAQLEKLVAQL